MKLYVAAFAALSALTVSFTDSASAGSKSSQVSWGFQAREDALSASASLTTATNGDLSTDGYLVRISVRQLDRALDDSDLVVGAADILLGQQWVGEKLRYRLFAGATVVDRDYTGSGSGTEEGTHYGFKAVAQVTTTKESPLYVSATASYSTVLNQYLASLETGWRFGTYVFGPEVQIAGSDTFETRKVGAFLQGIKIGRVSITPSAGYAFGGEESKGGDSPYGDLGLGFQF
jgi:hypothetical protein